MNTGKLKIGQIRDIIRAARWLRNDLTGGTSEEFRRQTVGPQLEAKIAQLKALDIPARFVEDIARRNEEIEFCARVIGRWEERQRACTPAGAADREAAARHVATRPQLYIVN